MKFHSKLEFSRGSSQMGMTWLRERNACKYAQEPDVRSRTATVSDCIFAKVTSSFPQAAAIKSRSQQLLLEVRSYQSSQCWTWCNTRSLRAINKHDTTIVFKRYNRKVVQGCQSIWHKYAQRCLLISSWCISSLKHAQLLVNKPSGRLD